MYDYAPGLPKTPTFWYSHFFTDDDKQVFNDKDVIDDEHADVIDEEHADVIDEEQDDDGRGVGEPASWRAWGKTRLCWLSLIMELRCSARRLTSVIRVILIFE